MSAIFSKGKEMANDHVNSTSEQRQRVWQLALAGSLMGFLLGSKAAAAPPDTLIGYFVILAMTAIGLPVGLRTAKRWPLNQGE